jgi:hypothetical protein
MSRNTVTAVPRMGAMVKSAGYSPYLSPSRNFSSIKQTLTGSSKIRGESHSTKTYYSIQ